MSPGGVESPRRRTRIEELRGVPLSGKGADLDMVGGRRCGEKWAALHSRESTERETKTELNGICIDQKLQKRHYSAPPESRYGENFKHVLHAEDFAKLLGRPEGTGQRTPREMSPPESPVQRAPFRVEHKDLKGALFYSNNYIWDGKNYMRRSASAKDFSTSYDGSGTASPRSQREYIAPEAAQPRVGSPPLRVGSPSKSHRHPDDSPRTPARNLRSEYSVLSASTGCTATDEGATPNTSVMSSPASPGASPNRRFRAPRTSACRTVEYLQEEQRKARRRAAWVA